MKQFVYPAVLYFDKESDCYSVAFHDINVYTEGLTVEDAFLKARDFLSAYCEVALKVNNYVEPASAYLETVKKHKNEIVLLVDGEVHDETVYIEKEPDPDQIDIDQIDSDFKLSDA